MRHDLEPTERNTTHPLSPDYDDQREVVADMIREAILNNPLELEPLAFADDRATAVMWQVTIEHLAGRNPSRELLGELRQALSDVAAKEAEQRAQ